MGNSKDKNGESLFTLVGQLPELVSNLVKAEVAQLKQHYTHKAKYAGIGAGLFAGAAVFLYFAVGVLVALLILVFALFLPTWLAALVVFVLFVLIAAVLAFIGIRFFKKMSEEPGTAESVKQDVNALRGMGDYDRR